MSEESRICYPKLTYAIDTNLPAEITGDDYTMRWEITNANIDLLDDQYDIVGTVNVTTETDTQLRTAYFRGHFNLLFALNYNISWYAGRPHKDTQWTPTLASYFVANYTSHAHECISTILCMSIDCSEGYLNYNLRTWTLEISPIPAIHIGETHIYRVTVECGSVL